MIVSKYKVTTCLSLLTDKRMQQSVRIKFLAIVEKMSKSAWICFFMPLPLCHKFDRALHNEDDMTSKKLLVYDVSMAAYMSCSVSKENADPSLFQTNYSDLIQMSVLDDK
jgi:hypothetical protein